MFFLTHSVVYANFTAVHVAGGTIIPLTDTKIELVREDIFFDFHDDYWNVSLNYNFYNHGEDQKLDCGFPKWCSPQDLDFFNSHEYTNFKDISFSKNGNTLPFIRKKVEETFVNDTVITEWYVLNCFFKKNDYANITINYSTRFGQNGFENMTQYLFGTGSTWYSVISTMKIRIRLSEDIWMHKLAISGISDYKLIRTGVKEFEINLSDREPEYYDTITFTFDNPDRTFNWSVGIYTDEENKKYDDRKLDIDYVRMLSKENLRYYMAFFRIIAGYPTLYKGISDYVNRNKIVIDKSNRNLESWKYNIELIDEYMAKADQVIR